MVLARFGSWAQIQFWIRYRRNNTNIVKHDTCTTTHGQSNKTISRKLIIRTYYTIPITKFSVFYCTTLFWKKKKYQKQNKATATPPHKKQERTIINVIIDSSSIFSILHDNVIWSATLQIYIDHCTLRFPTCKNWNLLYLDLFFLHYFKACSEQPLISTKNR